MSSQPSILDIGSTVGDYEIIGFLGRGGMGKVFRVRNVISNRVEAMKVLLPDMEEMPDLAERFLREIRVVASLEHANIASLRTAQRLGNQLLMIMEYVEGSSLDQKMREERMEVSRAVHYAKQVLKALAHAHRQGIVHRDVKPSNILIGSGDAVKLTDFGIASRTGDAKLTAPGRAVGSLYYMSPEQIRARPLDARSDLYSVSVTLYEMLTGRLPIEGDSYYAILKGHLEQIPRPPIELAPHLPPQLSRVVEKGLAKVPEDRFQTADEYRTALLDVGTPQSAVPTASSLELPPLPRPASGPKPVASSSLNDATATRLPGGRETPASGQGTVIDARTWDPAVLEIAWKKLAVFIGPMAKVIVSRAAKKAQTVEDLYRTLAAEIPSPAEREKFLHSARFGTGPR